VGEVYRNLLVQWYPTRPTQHAFRQPLQKEDSFQKYLAHKPTVDKVHNLTKYAMGRNLRKFAPRKYDEEAGFSTCTIPYNDQFASIFSHYLQNHHKQNLNSEDDHKSAFYTLL
jgi:hypothetical protein